MDQQILQWVIIGITVAFIALEKAKKLFNKGSNPGYGERIAALEKGQENIEDRLERIENKVNGVGG